MPDTTDRIDALSELLLAVASAVVEEHPRLAGSIGGRVRLVMRDSVDRPAAFDEATMFLSRFEAMAPVDA